MKVAEIINGIVTSFPPFWKSTDEIPKDVPPIYFDVLDEVQEGWLHDVETNTFTKPEIPAVNDAMPELTLVGLSQQISDLKADLIIAGVIE